jgi:hypothetical protein
MLQVRAFSISFKANYHINLDCLRMVTPQKWLVNFFMHLIRDNNEDEYSVPSILSYLRFYMQQQILFFYDRTDL